jgi:PatG C-terminal/Subtilase family
VQVSETGQWAGSQATIRESVRRPLSKERGPFDLRIAVIDGPYDPVALDGVLANKPISFGNRTCGTIPNKACEHGTFVVGLLGARRDALIPGICPNCTLLHIPLFVDEANPHASVDELARCINVAVANDAQLINLSLAILGDNSQRHNALARSLDYAAANGAVVVAAAGNQGRLAMGQLLSHPVTIPVVAVDAVGRLLRDSNFGPLIARRGIAASGYEVLGYAPGGQTTVMSGTSVATAVATGTLALFWSARPGAKGADICAAVRNLSSRNSAKPPILDPNLLLAASDEKHEASIALSPFAIGRSNYVSLQGDRTMADANAISRLSNSGIGLGAVSGPPVIPAQGPTGCTCGASGGVCSCTDTESSSQFIYVLGSVDIRFPDQSISEELQAVARKNDVVQGANEHLRDWYFRVLRNPDARYVARQVCWILKVEGIPAYYLGLRDWHDLPDLISCLDHSEDDLDLFVGSSTLKAVDGCPGVVAPVLAVDQISSREKDHLIEWFGPLREKRQEPKGKASRSERSPNEDLFRRLVQSADNLGDTDEWRALNYLAANYRPLYECYARMLGGDHWALDSVKVQSSRLSREKRIVDPVFAFLNKETGIVQKYFVRVDVSHLFPMIVNHIAEYFDR